MEHVRFVSPHMIVFIDGSRLTPAEARMIGEDFSPLVKRLGDRSGRLPEPDREDTQQ